MFNTALCQLSTLISALPIYLPATGIAFRRLQRCGPQENALGWPGQTAAFSSGAAQLTECD
jgi:hypothetical protein